MLKAAIEDEKTRQTIEVAHAPLAVYLARVLNDLEAGRPLPPQGKQHRPRRFQLVHDLAFGTKSVAVQYVHRMHERPMALAPTEEAAESIAWILNYVDYPMHERPVRFPWTLPPLPLVGTIGELPERLPAASFDRRREALSPRRRALLVTLVLWSSIPLVAVTVLEYLVFGWPLVALTAALWVVAYVLALRRLRE